MSILNNTKEETTNTCNSVDESQYYCANWKKADSKNYTMDSSIYVTFLKSKTIGIKIWSVAARPCRWSRECITKAYRGTLQCHRNMMWWKYSAMYWLWGGGLHYCIHLSKLRTLYLKRVSFAVCKLYLSKSDVQKQINLYNHVNCRYKEKLKKII